MSPAGFMELLRHGDTGQSGFRGRLDDPLTPLGVRQMEQALQEAPPWHAVFSSPRLRCAAFAQDYAQRLGLPLHLEERLSELDFGAWEGVPIADIQRLQPELLGKFWQDPWNNSPPQGESLPAFEQRIRAILHDIQQRHTQQRVLVITHAGVIRVALTITGQLPPQALLQHPIPHASRHRLEYGL